MLAMNASRNLFFSWIFSFFDDEGVCGGDIEEEV